MAGRPRIALVVDEASLRLEAERALSPAYALIRVRRGRAMAADLIAARPHLIVLEAVHPNEAAWIVGWLRAQPRLLLKPLVVILPFGPPPTRRAQVRFLAKPVAGPALASRVRRLLRAS